MISLPRRIGSVTYKRLSALSLMVGSMLGAVSFSSAAPMDQRLANLSTRGVVGTGANIMITGFVVQGKKDVLIRAVGPRLAASPFSLTGYLAAPKLDLYKAGATVPFMTNTKWLAADAATMTSVGAFALTTGSADSAIFIHDLDAGVYTAQVTGVNSTTGIALLEVYDVTGSPRLMNISTRAVVGKDANMLISGLVVAPSGGIRKVLIRAIGPGLAALGVPSPLTDPIFSVINGSGQTIASNDNWSTADVGGQLTAAFTQAGAFALASGSKDAALIVDLPPNSGTTSYTIQVSSVDGTSGPGLIEVYDLTSDNLVTVGVTASVTSTDTNGAAPGAFTFSRLGATTTALTISYELTGSAIAGTDYEALSGSVTIPAGASTATVLLKPKSNTANGNNRYVTLNLTSGATYAIGASSNATVTIFYSSGSLYVANLRTAPGITGSTAYGTATIQLSPDEQSAFINVGFSNLSSPEVVAHLVLDGNYIYNLPQGQVSGALWTFDPTGAYSKADLIAAFKAGRVYVSIDTASFPTGELTGSFLKSSATGAFTVPSTAPTVNLATVTSQDAARFLTQATFGPTSGEISALMQKGYATWMTEQMAMPASLHRTATMADFTQYVQSATQTTPTGTDRQAAWWKIATTSQDQLRQRVAFALSEILVISDQNTTINNWQEGAANYYDILVNGAFGNFRTLLENVTLSPMMGIYLSSLRNAKAAGTSAPDENYAREVMQLFTVGLNELQPDGTLKLDPSGQPIPTYNQDTVVQTAKIFTGFSFYNATASAANFRGGAADYINPMSLYASFHEDSQKTIIGNKIIAANQGGTSDLRDTLDALFNHANTAPFISRQLIQRLVTSNPSPGYVYRVAQVFSNNGAGIRGDLGAVVRAILTDYEARSATLLNTPGHGKLKEPLLRTTAMFRAYGATSNNGRYSIANPESLTAQAALRANTVFNFFEPDYVQSGNLAAAGLYAREFEILTDTTAITVPNFLRGYLYTTKPADVTSGSIYLDLSPLTALVKTPQAMLDAINLALCANTMPKATSDRIIAALAAMPAGTADLEKARSAVYLALTTSAGAVQK